MTKQEPSTAIAVSILGHEYNVSCPESEHDALLASARYLDEKMRSIRDAGKVMSLDRIAVMAALNITHEMLQKPVGKTTKKSSMDEERIGSLIAKIDRTLHQHLELDL